MDAYNQISENLWEVQGPWVNFLGIPFPTSMFIIRLSNSKLWIHSPIQLTNDLMFFLNTLGEVTYLISPTHLHNIFIKDWKQKFPNSKVFFYFSIVYFLIFKF